MALKRIGSILLVMVLVLGICSSAVYAQATAELQEANVLATVRLRIGDTAQYENFDSSSRTAKNGVVTYRFEWSSQKDNDYKSLSVACTSGGVITEYYVYDSTAEYQSDKPDLNRMESAVAMEKAKVLMDRLNPQLAGSLVLSQRGVTESLYELGYTYTVERVENGLPFYGQNGTIRVNAAADTIENFYINYDETLTVPEKQNLISRAQAEATYAELLGMKLVYKSYVKDRKRIIYPVYVPAADSYLYVSATEYMKVADMRSASGGNTIYAGALGSDSLANKNEAMDRVEFTEAELAELEKVAGLANSDEILEKILNNSLLDMPENTTVMRTARNKDVYTDKYTYSYYLQGDARSVNITADAKDGRLLSFSTYRDVAADETNNTTEAAKAAAAALAGEVFGEYRADTTYNNNFGVRYYRYVNNVPYYNDSIYVSVHPKSGKVTSFSMNYTEAEFPSVAGAMTPVKAAEAMFGVTDYAPYLMARYDADAVGTVETVYVPDETKPLAVDPFTGVLLQNYSNDPYKETVWHGYTDIEGHYAQKQLETLARFGIRFAGETCAPDAVITQAEFVSLLANAFYTGGGMVGEDLDYAYRRAEDKGILTKAERKDDAPLTRLNAAVCLIRALGLDEVASLSDIYVCPFADVTENIGHVSILSAMGVVRGDGFGNFNPEGVLTRADAIILIYNYLSR